MYAVKLAHCQRELLRNSGGRVQRGRIESRLERDELTPTKVHIQRIKTTGGKRSFQRLAQPPILFQWKSIVLASCCAVIGLFALSPVWQSLSLYRISGIVRDRQSTLQGGSIGRTLQIWCARQGLERLSLSKPCHQDTRMLDDSQPARPPKIFAFCCQQIPLF